MIKYKVDKEKRTVIARFENGTNDVSSGLVKFLEPILEVRGGYRLVNCVVDKLENSGRLHIIGIAKCHEEDTWDDEQGRKIAKERLLRKFHVLANEVLLNAKKILDHRNTTINNIINSKINKHKKYQAKVNKNYKKKEVIRLFISQPMVDKTNEHIKAERKRLIKKVQAYYANAKIKVIDSFFENAPHEAKPLWFLGKSFTLLSEADVAIFAPGWDEYRGCKLEHEACVAYGIPHIDVFADPNNENIETFENHLDK